jgi:hypothetical protein
MVNDAELAAIIARKIFEAGSNPPSEATRIQFMTGRLGYERAMGGFGERPLADFIEGVLKEHRAAAGLARETGEK